jgi:hypothetical protein
MLYGVLYFAPDFRTPIAHTVDQNILQVQFSLSAFIASVLRAKVVPPIQRQDRQLSECVQNSGLDPGDAARHISGALVNETRHLAGWHLRAAPRFESAGVAVTLAGTIEEYRPVIHYGPGRGPHLAGRASGGVRSRWIAHKPDTLMETAKTKSVKLLADEAGSTFRQGHLPAPIEEGTG